MKYVAPCLVSIVFGIVFGMMLNTFLLVKGKCSNIRIGSDTAFIIRKGKRLNGNEITNNGVDYFGRHMKEYIVLINQNQDTTFYYRDTLVYSSCEPKLIWNEKY